VILGQPVKLRAANDRDGLGCVATIALTLPPRPESLHSEV